MIDNGLPDDLTPKSSNLSVSCNLIDQKCQFGVFAGTDGLSSGDQEYYEMLSREFVQNDIDEFQALVGGEYFIPQSILRHGTISEPIDVEYLNAEKRLLKKIMAEKKVKEWIAKNINETDEMPENIDRKPKTINSQKEKNVVRKRILEKSNRKNYDFPKGERQGPAYEITQNFINYYIMAWIWDPGNF